MNQNYLAEAKNFLTSQYFPDTVVPMGPYLHVRDKLFFISEFSSLWEIRPTSDRRCPLEVLLIIQF